MGCATGGMGGASHAGLVEKPEGRRGSADTDARELREVGPSGVDTHERGEAPLVVSAALAMAEGTAGVESAGGARKTTAAKSEALKPGAYGEAGSRCERPLHSWAWHGVDTPTREGKRALDKLERKQPREGHPRVGDRRWRELSGHEKKATE